MIINFFAAACTPPSSGGLVNSNGLPHTCADKGSLDAIFFIAFSIIGAITVLFIVIGGARYVMSRGEPDKVQQAKNEIRYAAMGLIITALAAAVVNFVLSRLK